MLSANPLFTGKERVIKERFLNPNIIFHDVIDFQFFNLFHTLVLRISRLFLMARCSHLISYSVTICYNMNISFYRNKKGTGSD